MSIEKDFLIDTREKYLNQNYENLIIKIVALKKEEIYQILYIRIKYTGDSQERYKIFEALDKKAIIIEDIINEQKLSERVIESDGNFIYLLNDLKLSFLKKIEFPENLDEFLQKIKSQYNIPQPIQLLDDINFVYFENLYSLGHVPDSGSINLMDRSIFEEFDFIKSTEEFTNKIFVKNGRLIDGSEYIQKNFGLFLGEQRMPKLIIIFPIKSFSIDYSFQESVIGTKIQIRSSISEEFKKLVDFFYVKGDHTYPIEKNDFNIDFNKKEDKLVQIAVFWKNESKLMPKDTNIYLKGFYFFDFTPNNLRQEITDLESEIDVLSKNLDQCEIIEEKLEFYPKITEKYRILRNRYYRLQSEGLSDVLSKIEEVENKRIKSYREFIQTLEEKFDRRDIDFQYYLRLNNMLYDRYIKNLENINRKYKDQISQGNLITRRGRTDISELNEMLRNLDRAFSNVVSHINDAFSKKDEFELVTFFEILGDINIHTGLINLLTPHPIIGFDFKNAEESYKKALKFHDKLSIPGVGRASIRVSEYMKIFNIFMKVDDLSSKIEYIQPLITSKESKPEKDYLSIPSKVLGSDKLNSPLIPPEVIEILKEIKSDYEKMGITYADLVSFIRQPPNTELKTALAFILRKVYLRTTKEIAMDLKELITTHVDNLDNIHLVLFEDIEMKSNELWNNLISRILERRIDYVKPDGFLDLIKKVSASERHFFIFLDNIIGLGGQFIEYFTKSFPSIIIGEVLEIKKINTNLFFKVIAAVGSAKSRESISKAIPIFEFDDIIYKKIIREEDQAFYPNNWSNETMLNNFKNYMKDIDPVLFAGRNDSQFLVITEDATPNNTIGCLWKNVKGKWKALSHRVSYSKGFKKNK